MSDRRRSLREKVIYGGVAQIGERGATRDCIVRNISEGGAHIEFRNPILANKQELSLAIARKGHSFLAKIIWLRDNFVGVAFNPEARSGPLSADLERRLRNSEKQKRQLQYRIKQLLGED